MKHVIVLILCSLFTACATDTDVRTQPFQSQNTAMLALEKGPNKENKPAPRHATNPVANKAVLFVLNTADWTLFDNSKTFHINGKRVVTDLARQHYVAVDIVPGDQSFEIEDPLTTGPIHDSRLRYRAHLLQGETYFLHYTRQNLPFLPATFIFEFISREDAEKLMATMKEQPSAAVVD